MNENCLLFIFFPDTSSGQVPERAVQTGNISRFGSIDNSEGGNNGRSNLNIRFAKQWMNN